ncbi:MAG: dehydratase [Acidimicrobiaceae bacterium]|nr:MAG: dehydratase [Acidimicrobiaceae bacterium]
MAVDEIRFDDVDALRARISSDYGEWGPELQITQDLIDDFADLTGDSQWIHVDVERAGSGPFGGTIAHGLLTLAIAPRVRPPALFQIVGHGSTLNYGSDGVRFLDPVYAGSSIHSRSRLIDVQQHARGTRLVLEIAVHVVGNERPSMVFKAVVLHSPQGA